MRAFITLTGVKGSGKTTSFSILKERFPFIHEVTLAKKLKDECAKAFNIERSWFDDPAFKETDLETPIYLDRSNVSKVIEGFGKEPEYDRYVRPHVGMIMHTPRRIAQYFGTEVLQAFGPLIHCEGVVRDLPESGIFVVTDMRFHHEFDFFKSQNPDAFHPFYVHNYKAEAQMGPNPHASEKYVPELGKKSVQIRNNGTLQELKIAVLDSIGLVIEEYKHKGIV